MDKKVKWEIVNFLVIIGYTIVSVCAGFTISMLLIHVFINVSPIESSLLPIIYVGCIGISFFVINRVFKFFNYFYKHIKRELIWVRNPSMREKVLSIKHIEPVEPEDDWIDKKNKKRWKR